MTEDEVYAYVMKAYNNRVTSTRDAAAAAAATTSPASTGVLVPRPPDCPDAMWSTVIAPCFCILDSVRPTISSLLPALAVVVGALSGGDGSGGATAAAAIDDDIHDRGSRSLVTPDPERSESEEALWASVGVDGSQGNGPVETPYEDLSDETEETDEAIVSVWAAAARRGSSLDEPYGHTPAVDSPHRHQPTVYEDE
jgi:hypothetical protein